MAEQTYSIEKDLKEAQAFTAGLIPYIYEDELYGRVSMNMPSLTVGALLLRLRRLRASRDRLTDTQAATLQQLEQQLQAVREEWQTHYNKKLLREAEARTRDILTYARECRDDPRLCANSYMPEALRRTIIQEVLSELPDSEVHSTGLGIKVKQADSALHGIVHSSDFIWDTQLQPVYPSDTFWWLYGKPQKP